MIGRKILFAFQETKLLLGHARHDRVLALAQRAIAHEPGVQFAFDLELHRAAMARAFMN